MSVLDGFLPADLKAEELLAAIQKGVGDARAQLGPEAAHLLEQMSEGASFADTLGFGCEHKEALFQLGCRFMLASDLDQAADVFLALALLDPLEERAHYGLGVVEQERGNFAGAIPFYLQFLVMDATSPKGYLRLGECLAAADELEEARYAFLMARQLAEQGHGDGTELSDAQGQLAQFGSNNAQDLNDRHRNPASRR